MEKSRPAFDAEPMSAADIQFRRREAIVYYRNFCWHRDLYFHKLDVFMRM